MNWSEPIRIESRGHRIFQEIDGKNRWAIADNTGPTPDTTESGILWIELALPIQVDMNQATMWVWSQRAKRGTRIALKIEGALYLVKKFGMKVEFSPAMHTLLELVDAAQSKTITMALNPKYDEPSQP